MSDGPAGQLAELKRCSMKKMHWNKYVVSLTSIIVTIRSCCQKFSAAFIRGYLGFHTIQHL